MPELPSFCPVRKLHPLAHAAWILLAVAGTSVVAQTPKPAPPPRPAAPAPAAPETHATKTEVGKPEPKSDQHRSSTSEAKPAGGDEHAPVAEGNGDPVKPDSDPSNITTTTTTPSHVVHKTPASGVPYPGEGRSSSSTTSSSTSTSTTTSPVNRTMLANRSTMSDRSQMRSSPEAEARLQSINAARARLSGVNHAPIPEGHVIASPNGRVNVMASAGRTYSLRPNGTLASYHAKGESATFRADGKLASFTSKDLSMHIGTHGERVVTAHRPDRSTLVSTGRHSGYLESAPPWTSVPADASRPTVIQRTYLRGSQTWHRSYLSYSYKGRTLKRYLPAVTYPASYYSWAWRGWPKPIVYKWTWIGSRWFFYYRNYFVLWPSYASASYWLTDYFLGETLDDGYGMQQQDDGSPNGSANGSVDEPANGFGDSGPQTDPQSDEDGVYATTATAISPEMKQAIAGEVQGQLALNSMSAPADASTEAAQGAPVEAPQFLQAGYVFVVDSPRSVVTSSSSSETAATSTLVNAPHCGLSPGDVLRLSSIPPDSAYQMPRTVVTSSGSTAVMVGRPAFEQMEVMASHRGDCPAGIQVRMTIEELQEMEDNFEARLDDGLQVLHGKQGKDGVPSAPAGDSVAAAPTPSAAANAPSAAELSAQLEALESQANQAATQLTQTVLTAQAPQ